MTAHDDANESWERLDRRVSKSCFFVSWPRTIANRRTILARSEWKKGEEKGNFRERKDANRDYLRFSGRRRGESRHVRLSIFPVTLGYE